MTAPVTAGQVKAALDQLREEAHLSGRRPSVLALAHRLAYPTQPCVGDSPTSALTSPPAASLPEPTKRPTQRQGSTTRCFRRPADCVATTAN